MFPGIADRMQSELMALAPSSMSGVSAANQDSCSQCEENSSVDPHRDKRKQRGYCNFLLEWRIHLLYYCPL